MIPAWTIRVLSSAKVLLPVFIAAPILAHFLLPASVADIIGGIVVLAMMLLGLLGTTLALLYFIGGYRIRCPKCGEPADMDKSDLYCWRCGTIKSSGLWSYRVIPPKYPGSSLRWRPNGKEVGNQGLGVCFGVVLMFFAAVTIFSGEIRVGKNGSGDVLTPEGTPVAFYSTVAGFIAFGLLSFGLVINNVRLRRRASREAAERERIRSEEKSRLEKTNAKRHRGGR